MRVREPVRSPRIGRIVVVTIPEGCPLVKPEGIRYGVEMACTSLELVSLCLRRLVR